MEATVSSERIESFLEGSNEQKYIVAIESYYDRSTVDVIVNDPIEGKKIISDKYEPFLWSKDGVDGMLYNGCRKTSIAARAKFGITIVPQRITNFEGIAPDRLSNGYKFLIKCSKTYNHLIAYYKQGGIDIFHEEYRKNFVCFSPTEQYMIQSGKRMFKGMDDYDDLHRMQFDLETEGLFANKHAIFQIGVRDNRGNEIVVETKGVGYAKRDSERENIKKFFRIIDVVKPDIITGYNSENFDWPFIFQRAEILNIPITEFAITLNRISKIKRKKSTVKFGGETEHYDQTNLWGYNIIDISHAVRRAMAINSEIKAWGLKYITQYSEIAKQNRVYVAGDKINTIWADKINNYAFNDSNGDYYVISDKTPLKIGYEVKQGDFIVQRYLCDDLWETEQIDNLFNQASFLIGKMLPTTFQRSSTMGTAGQWKLIMAAWSYENNLGIPETQPKREFTGGLARLLEVGYAVNVVKLDFAALYPKIELTHSIFPSLDISGMMKGTLTYVVDKRDEFKFLTTKEKKIYKALENRLKIENDTLTEIEKIELSKAIIKHKGLANLYDKKQLPLKILANSWFGSYGAPYIFNWGDVDCAEETTCRGRQYLRLMVRHFTEKYGFRALVMDTDGANFASPDNIAEIKYTAKGSHWKTVNDANIELTGLDAVLAEFNENFMEGRMGLDIDDVCNSTINFARKNYANDIGGKIKLVGNSVKSKAMSVYVEEFLSKAIRMLLDGDGYAFIQYYYEYVDKIYNYQIPLVKIASKSKVKLTIDAYKKKAFLKNKKGNPLPKQAHMELAIRDGLDINLADVLYYINIGSAKSHGDLKSIKNKETGLTTVNLNCKLIPPSVVDKDFEKIKELEMIKKASINLDDEVLIKEFNDRITQIDAELYTDEYNVSRYLDAFNKKVKPLLVCFNLDVRNNILLDIIKSKKDKVTKKVTERLKDRRAFTKAECELVSGIPNKPEHQDTYEDLMCMEDKEIKFWDKVDKVPNNMDESEWDSIRADYHERMVIFRLESIEREKVTIDDIFKHLEVDDLTAIITDGAIPIDIIIIADVSDDSEFFISKKWGEKLCKINNIFNYEELTVERNKFYIERNITKEIDKYKQWSEHLIEQTVLTGETSYDLFGEVVKPKRKITTKKHTENDKKTESEIVVVTKNKQSEVESEEDFEIDENGNRSNEIVILDDEFDDTYCEAPEELVIIQDIESTPDNSIDDEWGF